MLIDPAQQLLMLLGAFWWGYLSGLVLEGMFASHILLGVYLPPGFIHRLYQKPLPLLHRCASFPKAENRRWIRGAVRALTQILFCVIFAVGVMLLLYYYNNGAIRISVLLLALVGLGSFRLTLSRILPYLTAYLAFGLAVLRAYLWAALCLPVRVLLVLLRMLCAPLHTLCKRLYHRSMARRSSALCRRQLALAQVGLLERAVIKTKKEEKDAKREKDPHGVDHSHTRRAALRRGARHLGKSPDGVEQGKSRAGGPAGKAGS